MYRCATKYNSNLAVIKFDERKKICLNPKVYLLLQLVGSRREKESEYGNWDDYFS